MTRKVTRIILHHSAGESMNGAVATMKAQGLHYHRLIDKDGSIFIMRDYDLLAYHAGPKGNPESIGICLIGNFYQTGRMPTEEQYTTLLTLIEDIEKVYGRQQLVNHYEIGATVCPGFDMVLEVKNHQAILEKRKGMSEEFEMQLEMAKTFGIITTETEELYKEVHLPVVTALNKLYIKLYDRDNELWKKTVTEIDRRIAKVAIKPNPETGVK